VPKTQPATDATHADYQDIKVAKIIIPGVVFNFSGRAEKGIFMNNTDILSKIRKLLALSTSPNEHEAANAAAKAREFLAKYNISVADLPMAEKERAATDVQEREIELEQQRTPSWVKDLFWKLGRLFGVEVIYTTGKHCSKPIITVLGLLVDIEAFSATFEYLTDQIGKLAEKDLPDLVLEHPRESRVTLRLSYSTGCAHRVVQRVREFTYRARHEEERRCMDLIIMKRDAIKAYTKRRFPHLRTDHIRGASNGDAYTAGFNAANRIALGRPGVRRLPQ
jgi:hypothetical protein